jgi:hypothetical protein
LEFVKNVEPNGNDYTMHTALGKCNCDYPKRNEKYSLETNGLRVTIMSKDGTTMYPKMKNDLANLNGVVHISVPTTREYIIVVDNLNDSENSYLSFKSGSVGDKKITINDGRLIYYTSNIEIKGFKTGTNDSFMFISQCQQEKEEGKVLEGENITNVIKLTVKKWDRKKKAERVGSLGGYAHGYNDWGESGMYSSQCRGVAAKGGSKSKKPKGGMGGIFKNDPTNACLDMEENFSGGATVSGGSRVDDVRTKSTSDTFTDLNDDTEIVIQLVCTQTEEEKLEANKKYYLKKAIAERNELGKKMKRVEDDMTYYSKQVTLYQGKFEEETAKMNELKKDMEKYAYLGSADKDDYLMVFANSQEKVVDISE